MMNVRSIALSDVSPVDEEKWRDLATRAASPNPMSEPECVLPAVRHLQNGSKVQLIVVEHEGRFEACLPLQRVSRWHVLPRPALSTRIRRMTWDATPLVDPERGNDAMYAVLAELSTKSSRGNPSLLVFEWLNERGPIGGYVRTAAQALGLPLRVNDTWDQPFVLRREEPTYTSMHSKKHLYNWRRQLRMLERDHGAEPKLVDRGNEWSGPSTFVDLEASGYKNAEGVAMRTQAGETDWFLDMSNQFAREGRLHVLALELGDATIAMVVLIRSGEGLSLVKVSYDERFERYSPGALLHLATLDWFHNETDASWIDVCTYKNNTALQSQYPERRAVSTLVLGLRGDRDRNWLRMLDLDPVFRRGISEIGRRLNLKEATLGLLLDGGGYGQMQWGRGR